MVFVLDPKLGHTLSVWPMYHGPQEAEEQRARRGANPSGMEEGCQACNPSPCGPLASPITNLVTLVDDLIVIVK